MEGLNDLKIAGMGVIKRNGVIYISKQTPFFIELKA